MEREKFLKGSLQSLMGASMLPLMTANNLCKQTEPGSLQVGKTFNPDSSDAIFNIYDYGAQGDGKQMDTKALQQAIDACNKAGGGRVLLPGGTFLTGTIFLKSHVFLELSAGATLLGSTNIADFNAKHTHLIYAHNVEHAGIIGEGTINGQGDTYWRGKDRPYKRPGGYVAFEVSEQIKLQGITITNSPGWTVFITRCNRVQIDGISIINDPESPNTDGIDPISSSNVFISNCYIDTGDDAICLKADKAGPCENIVVTNCILRSDDSALKCGTSSHGNIRRCLFNNIQIWDTTMGISFFVKDKDSIYEDIQFSNINIGTKKLSTGDRKKLDKHNLQHFYPIFMDVEPRTPQSGLGTIRNISIKDLIIDTWNGNCLIQGRKDKYIENISLENIFMRVHTRTDYTGRTKPRGTRTLTKKASNDFSDVPSHFTFGNIAGLNLDNITIEDVSEETRYQRREIWGTHLTDVDIAGINYQQAPADKRGSVISLQNCKNVLLKDSRSPHSEAPFITIKGRDTRNVNVIGNDFFDAKQGVSLIDVGKNVLFESANRQPDISDKNKY